MAVVVSSRRPNAFYKAMGVYCENNGIPFIRKINNRIGRKFPIRGESAEDLILSYHTVGKIPDYRIWHYKPDYIPKALFFDTCGYSARAEVATDDAVVVREFIKKNCNVEQSMGLLKKLTIDSNASKLNKVPRVKGRIHNGDFILFAGQVPKDTVIRHSFYGSYQKMLSSVLPELDKLGIKILFRPHPRAGMVGLENPTEYFRRFKNIEFFNGPCSIHQLIEESMGVISVNSGVGFEGLIHGRPVFTLGGCDYGCATHALNSLDKMAEIPSLICDNHSDMAQKYLHYHLNNSVVFRGNSPMETVKNIFSFTDNNESRLHK